MKLPIIILGFFSFLVIGITGCWDFVAEHILPRTTWGLYSREFFENVLVEAHGMILDLFVLSVLLVWFERRKTKFDQITNHQKALSYLKFYRGTDASFRVYEAVRALAALKCNRIDLPNANLSELLIEDLKLDHSNLKNARFMKTSIRRCEFIDCVGDAALFIDASIKQTKFIRTTLRRAKFVNAKLNGCDFSTAIIISADFTRANLRSAIFKDVDCKDVCFDDADLTAANFVGAKNLTQQMLDRAKTYKNAKF